MHLSEAPRRNPMRSFVNHMPRDIEMNANKPSRSSGMPLSSFSMAYGAVPRFTNANMEQTFSEIQREGPFRKVGNAFSRAESFDVEEERSGQSRPDSPWSIHCSRTDQAPFTLHIAGEDDKTMAQNSLLTLSKSHASHDLAFFLRTTGPTASHRRPSKLKHQWRGTSGTKQALKRLKLRHKKRLDPVMTAHKRLTGAIDYHDKDPMFLDEGGLLNDIGGGPPISEPLVIQGAEQKVSSNGKRYMALVTPYPPNASPITATAPIISHDVLDSRVSISFPGDMNSDEVLDGWLLNIGKERVPRAVPSPPPPPQLSFGNKFYSMGMPGSPERSSTPIRPAAPDPPTPLLPEPDELDTNYYHTRSVSNTVTADSEPRSFRSHYINNHLDGRSTPFNGFPPEDNLVGRSSPQKEPRILSPSPKRLFSHQVLLQRTSSTSSSVYPPSAESPGPPPPKSPLRVLGDHRAIADVIKASNKATICHTSNITSTNTLSSQRGPIRPTVVTDCTGPIKRPKSRTRDGCMSLICQPSSNSSRKERVRARKLRDKPSIARTIDAVVKGALLGSQSRLKKARPQVRTPDLRPAPLVTRVSSSAINTGSWREVSKPTRTPVSPISSADDLPILVPGKHRSPISPIPSEPIRASKKNSIGFQPIAPLTTHTDNRLHSALTLSPVMLIAEEIPLFKNKPSRGTMKVVAKERKGYAPRPRFASMSRKRRSRVTQSQPRSTTPMELQRSKVPTPPLPSPPPNRCLPPTPPASASERPSKSRISVSKEIFPGIPFSEISHGNSIPRQIAESLPHVGTQARQRKSNYYKDVNMSSRVDARLEALEKQNALLSAALMAVLKTNGALNNGVRASLVETDIIKSPIPMTWERRIARRSAASHAASSSTGNALDVYMNTRQGGGPYGM